jgi:hypothetical protein
LEKIEMKKRVICAAMGASLLVLSAIGHAAAPADAPAGTTGLCKDGSYYSGPTKKGACKGHKGVKEWYADAAPATKPGAAAPAPAAVAPPATAPAGSTGLCKDGTYSSGPTKKGACKGHKGVKEWYGAPAAAAAPAAPATPAKAAAAPAAASASATPAAASPSTSKASKAPEAAAPGGGTGKVWVNKSTKVYHCPGDRWYGKTKEGEYVSEAEAVAQGAKPDHGKACK